MKYIIVLLMSVSMAFTQVTHNPIKCESDIATQKPTYRYDGYVYLNHWGFDIPDDAGERYVESFSVRTRMVSQHEIRFEFNGDWYRSHSRLMSLQMGVSYHLEDGTILDFPDEDMKYKGGYFGDHKYYVIVNLDEHPEFLQLRNKVIVKVEYSYYDIIKAEKIKGKPGTFYKVNTKPVKEISFKPDLYQAIKYMYKYDCLLKVGSNFTFKKKEK